jgi:DNA-binding NtrC family response regulator
MRILLLDDDDDLRTTMREILMLVDEGSHQCVAVGSFAQLLDWRAKALDTELAILDINLGPNEPSGLDAERWLRENGYKGRVVFLTGHARTHPLVVDAARLGNVQILEKPLGLGSLLDMVSERRAS